MSNAYTRGLHELGDGLYAYLQPDGGWGWSNAGLVTDGEATLLVDTLYDLRLTGEMLDAMRRAVPAAAEIDTLVNTHANGDHCYGNELVRGSRIVASRRAAEEMAMLPPELWAAVLEQAPQMGQAGRFLLERFGSFDYRGIELVAPTERFDGELSLRVGAKEVRLIEVGPAHTQGDTLAYLPGERVLYSGDILFNGGHPIVWAGPIANWIAACDDVLALDVELIVPGHGPLAGKAEVRELRAYFEYVEAEARRAHDAGLGALEAARSIALGRWVDWGERERLAANVDAVYREIEGREANPLELVGLMAEMAGS